MLIELSKVKAPSMLLSDFNYIFNKAINQYVNKRYNIYDVNQQTTDDLRVLRATAILTPTLATATYNAVSSVDSNYAGTTIGSLYGATYEVNLPSDYLHTLNCICVYKLNKQFKCYDSNSMVQFAAKRLTADAWSTIINDYYNRPTPERPYYYIHNVNTRTTIPTNPYLSDVTDVTKTNGTDMNGTYKVTSNNDSGNVINLPRTIKNGTDDQSQSLVEKNAAIRYGNASNVRMEIRYGKDNSIFVLQNILIDYLKVPQFIRLTQEQLDLTEDTSQIMEFPDYVCQEIINELVNLVMENTADPRLQTHIPVNQSIAGPAQQQEQPKK